MLVFDRVAQLTVRRSTGKQGLGSGYLVGEGLVLTAAHVVDDVLDDTLVNVSFPAAGAVGTGSVVWSGSEVGLDAALVRLQDAPAGIRSRAVSWGRLTGSRPGVGATAVGFPRALRETDGTRTPDQVDGTINPGTAFGERYDINLAGAHPLVQALAPSPWAGLSGAAAFCGDLLVAVIVIDTPRFQAGRLTSVPIWRLLADGGFRDVVEAVGCPTTPESVELSGLFERGRVRVDSPASLLRADRAVVRFRGRDRELAELTAWAHDEDAEVDGAVRLVTGPGGQGKTRLAGELCSNLEADGWIAGFAVRDGRRRCRLGFARHALPGAGGGGIRRNTT
jgi:hypothetical protein